MTHFFDLPHRHPKWLPLLLHYAIEKTLIHTLYVLAELLGDGVNGISRRAKILPTLLGGLNCGFKPCCIAWVIKLDVLDKAHTFAELHFLDEKGYIPCPKCFEGVNRT